MIVKAKKVARKGIVARFYAILAVFLMPVFSYAGVDFTGKSAAYYENYEIPVFLDKEQAVLWAKGIGYVEPVRRLLIMRMVDLMHKADLNGVPYSKVPSQARIAEAKELMTQWEYCKAALRVVESNKTNGAFFVIRVEDVR